MGSLSKQWRDRAEELDSALPPLMSSAGVIPGVIQATKAAILPELLLTMADLLDVLEAAPVADAKTQQARDVMQRNHRIRSAVAAGDFDALNGIIDEAVNKAINNANTDA